MLTPFRSFVLVVSMALYVVAFCSPVRSLAAVADQNTHEGKVVSAGDGKLTMTFGDDPKQHTHDVAKNATITVDGKEAKLDDLKADFHATVTVDDQHVVTKVAAHSNAK